MATDNSKPAMPRWWPIVALAVLILFHAAANMIWLWQDTRILFGDTGNHARISMKIAHILSEPDVGVFGGISEATTFWPPLTYLFTQPLYLIFGFNPDVSVATNTVLLALLIILTYLIGQRLYNQTAGVLAAAMVSFYPIVATISRTYYLDISLAVMVAAAFYLLLRSEAFSQTGSSLVFGALLGLGLLTKKTFFIFALGPGIAVAIMALTAEKGNGWRDLMAWRPQQPMGPDGAKLLRRLANLAGAVVLALIIALPWYLAHMETISRQASVVENVASGGFRDRPIWWYLSWLDDILLLLPFILFIVGFVTGLLEFRRNWFPIIWIVVPGIIYPLVSRGHMRYMIPLLPAVALLSAQWMVGIRRPALRRGLIALTIGFQLVAFFVVSWGLPSTLQERYAGPVQDSFRPFNVKSPEERPLVDLAAPIYFQFPPKAHPWPVRPILDFVWRDIEAGASPEESQRLTLLFKLVDFGYSSFSYENQLARERGRPAAQSLTIGDVPGIRDFALMLMDHDYLIFNSGVGGWREEANLINQRWLAGDQVLKDRFASISTISLGDGNVVEVLKRTGPPVKQLPPDEQRRILEYVLELSPESTQAQKLLARLNGEPVPLSASTQQQTIDPAVQAILNDAESLRAADNQAGAEAALLEGLQTRPDSLALWLALGDLYALGNRVQEADQAFSQALEIAPDDPSILLEQGKLWEAIAKAGDNPDAGDAWDKAANAYQRVIEVNPDAVRAYLGLAKYHRTRDDNEGAIDVYRRGLRHIPDNPWLNFGLGQTYFAIDRAEEALPYYQKAVELSPDNGSYHFQVGRASIELSSWDQAADALARALELDPNYADNLSFQYNLGKVHLGLEDYRKAVNSFTQVLDVNPRHQGAQFLLGEAQQGAGDDAEAAAAYRAVITQWPNSTLGQEAARRLQGLEN
ncbi:MAG: tetratricopeptide repeat protein [Chloroflexota bacterium]|nr:tetratricopeptide repeat protein [Chloroflexota bacterium]